LNIFLLNFLHRLATLSPLVRPILFLFCTFSWQFRSTGSDFIPLFLLPPPTPLTRRNPSFAGKL
jgi:hypothetical protein